MRVVVGLVVALVIVLWGATVFVVGGHDAGVAAPGNADPATHPTQLRVDISLPGQQGVSPAPTSIAAAPRNASRPDDGTAQTPNPATPADPLQGLTPQEWQQKQVMWHEELKRQAEQDANADAFVRQDKGAELYAQHVAPRAIVAPEGNTQ